jgi:type IV pilus assembly protein PilA
MKPRHAFTLIELLIVVVIIGILAAIAIPKYARSKDQAYVGRMKTDLRNFANEQESYFSSYRTYAPNTAALTSFNSSSGVTITVLESGSGGWSARAASTSTPTECVLVYGTATLVTPATTDGVIACN